jgi:hypothetical protein
VHTRLGRWISTNKKSVLLFFREEKQRKEGKMEVSASLEVWDNEQKQQLEQLIESYKKVFKERKG